MFSATQSMFNTNWTRFNLWKVWYPGVTTGKSILKHHKCFMNATISQFHFFLMLPQTKLELKGNN